MTNVYRYSVSVVAAIAIILAGCKTDSTPLEPRGGPTLTTYQPKGTIHGVILDACTNEAVAGALLSVSHDGGVQNVTSDAAGQFSFADVPAGRFQVIPGGGFVFTGTYTVTASLVNYNAGQSDPNKKYRNYYYNTVTITFTSLVPGDSLGVSGLVGSIVFTISNLNTIIAGTVVDENMQPVGNALVTLVDLSVVPNAVISQTSTTSGGEYRFTQVDNGITVMIRALSSDGNREGALTGPLTLPCNQTYDTLRSQVLAERIRITPVDNVAPFVISITPEHNADVGPSGLQVVYTFSEPIKQTSYTRTDLPVGHGTILDDIVFSYDGLKKITGPIAFTAQWNTLFTQLTLSPQGIIGSAKYSVDARTAFTPARIQDRASLGLVNNTSITGDFEVLQFTTNGSSAVPAAPVLVRRFVSGLFGELEYTGGTVGLEWNSDANARSYSVYKSIDGGSFELLQRNFFGLQFTDNSGSLVSPSGAANPLRSVDVRYQVRAVSKDLVEGSASNIITVRDGVRPRLITATVAAAPPPAPANTWLYTVQFSEPLILGRAETVTNYTFSNTSGVTFTVNAADYLGFNAGTGRYHVQLLVTTSAALPAGYVLVVPSATGGVTDLAGNLMDPAANSRTF